MNNLSRLTPMNREEKQAHDRNLAAAAACKARGILAWAPTPVHYPPAGGWGRNKWCGPTAIAVVTGLQTHEAAAVVRAETGNTVVMGTDEAEVASALKRCGYKLENLTGVAASDNLRKIPKEKRVSLAAWLRHSEAGPLQGPGVKGIPVHARPIPTDLPVLVSCCHHWIILFNNQVLDRTWCGAARREKEHRKIRNRRRDAEKTGRSYSMPRLGKLQPKPISVEDDYCKRRGKVTFIAAVVPLEQE